MEVVARSHEAISVRMDRVPMAGRGRSVRSYRVIAIGCMVATTSRRQWPWFSGSKNAEDDAGDTGRYNADPLHPPIPVRIPMKRHQLNLRKRVENKCGIGERGQIPKNVTGLENEVGTPHQLRFLPNNFRGSYVLNG